MLYFQTCFWALPCCIISLSGKYNELQLSSISRFIMLICTKCTACWSQFICPMVLYYMYIPLCLLFFFFLPFFFWKSRWVSVSLIMLRCLVMLVSSPLKKQSSVSYKEFLCFCKVFGHENLKENGLGCKSRILQPASGHDHQWKSSMVMI